MGLHGNLENKDAVHLLCDLLLTNEQDFPLLPFVMTALLMEVSSTDQMDFDRLKEHVQGEILCRLCCCGIENVPKYVERACDLYEWTPMTLSAALFIDDKSVERLKHPVCMVEPAEALYHVYGRIEGNWRLIFIDVRAEVRKLMLPVCLCFNKDELAAVQKLPVDERIHLCLVGDGPPEPGDRAFELCQHLYSPPVSRQCVSAIRGGWPAIEGLAKSLGYELLEYTEEPSIVSAGRPTSIAVAEQAHSNRSAGGVQIFHHDEQDRLYLDLAAFLEVPELPPLRLVNSIG